MVNKNHTSSKQIFCMPSIKKKVKSEQVTFKLPLLILELPWVTKAEFHLTITSIQYQVIPNSPNKNHENCITDSKENYYWDLQSKTTIIIAYPLSPWWDTSPDCRPPTHPSPIFHWVFPVVYWWSYPLPPPPPQGFCQRSQHSKQPFLWLEPGS